MSSPCLLRWSDEILTRAIQCNQIDLRPPSDPRRHVLAPAKMRPASSRFSPPDAKAYQLRECGSDRSARNLAHGLQDQKRPSSWSRERSRERSSATRMPAAPNERHCRASRKPGIGRQVRATQPPRAGDNNHRQRSFDGQRGGDRQCERQYADPIMNAPLQSENGRHCKCTRRGIFARQRFAVIRQLERLSLVSS